MPSFPVQRSNMGVSGPPRREQERSSLTPGDVTLVSRTADKAVTDTLNTATDQLVARAERHNKSELLAHELELKNKGVEAYSAIEGKIRQNLGSKADMKSLTGIIDTDTKAFEDSISPELERFTNPDDKVRMQAYYKGLKDALYQTAGNHSRTEIRNATIAGLDSSVLSTSNQIGLRATSNMPYDLTIKNTRDAIADFNNTVSLAVANNIISKEDGQLRIAKAEETFAGVLIEGRLATNDLMQIDIMRGKVESGELDDLLGDKKADTLKKIDDRKESIQKDVKIKEKEALEKQQLDIQNAILTSASDPEVNMTSLAGLTVLANATFTDKEGNMQYVLTPSNRATMLNLIDKKERDIQDKLTEAEDNRDRLEIDQMITSLSKQDNITDEQKMEVEAKIEALGSKKGLTKDVLRKRWKEVVNPNSNELNRKLDAMMIKEIKDISTHLEDPNDPRELLVEGDEGYDEWQTEKANALFKAEEDYWRWRYGAGKDEDPTKYRDKVIIPKQEQIKEDKAKNLLDSFMGFFDMERYAGVDDARAIPEGVIPELTGKPAGRYKVNGRIVKWNGNEEIQ